MDACCPHAQQFTRKKYNKMDCNSESVSALNYLEALYESCLEGDLVFTRGMNKVAKVFSCFELEDAAKFIESYDGGDLCLKINPMDNERTVARNRHGVGNKDEVAAIVSFHLDVDCCKTAKYPSREEALQALADMPMPPSIIVNTNGADGGFHAYWLLNCPEMLDDDKVREKASQASRNWLQLLRERLPDKVVDGTADICRVLRPIGSLRSSGNRVSAHRFEPWRRYSFDAFVAWIPKAVEPVQPVKRHDGESVIAKYLDSQNISVRSILQGQGYSEIAQGEWIRPASESGSKTGVEFAVDGREGFTVYSGNVHPLSCDNGRGGTGNWYSREALWLSFEFNVDANGNPGVWKEAADIAKRELDKQAADGVCLDHIVHGVKDEGIVKNCGQLLEKFAQRILSGESQKLLEIKAPLNDLEIGPGLITVLGAGPGAGKTALASQIAFTHLECDEKATVTFANAEMDFDALLIREVARRSCLPYKALRFAELDKYQREDFEHHIDQLRPLCKRIRWIEPPHSIPSLMECEAFDPGLVIVDYLQKFSPTDCDARQGVGRVMTYLRQLARSGWAVLALSATARTQGKAGSGHDGKSLSMASFRESGEVEFNADAAYLLRHQGDIDGKSWLRDIQLSCVKNRHGDLEERSLVFNAAGMRFETIEPVMTHWEPSFTAVASEAPTTFEGRF